MANTTVNIDIQVQSKSLNELEQELAQINAELKDVPVNSKAFKDLSLEAQGLTKQLNAATAAAEGFTSEEKFRAADGAIKLMGGSLASVVGTLGILGVESEAFGEFEEKAASAIAVAIGFKDIGEGITQLGPLLGKAGAAVKGFSLTTRQALIATGVGIFVVALGTVIAYWDDIVAGVEKFGEKVPFVGKAIDAIKSAFDSVVESFRPVLEFLGILPDAAERANNAVIASNEKLIESGERELALLQARGASEEEIYNKKKQLLEAELDNLKRTDAEKEEIYKAETELLVLEQEERTRIAKEEEEKRTEILEKEAEKRKQTEEEYTSLYEELQSKLASISEQTEEELLKIEKEGVINRIKELDVEDERKKKLLDEYTDYYKKKEEELTKKHQEERRKRREDEVLHALDVATIIGDSYKEYFDLTVTGYDQRKELLGALRQSEIDDTYAEFDQLMAANKEYYEQQMQAEVGNYEELARLQENYNVASEQLTEANNVKIKSINAYYAAQEVLLEEEKNAVKLQVALQAAQGFQQLLNIIGEENKAAAIAAIVIEKAAAVAQIIANTAIANAKLVAAFPVTLGQPWVGINTAGAAASIAATVLAGGKAIGQINSDSPSIGGGSTGLSAPSAPTTQAQTPNIQERAPQALNASPTTRAYVLSGDITSSQEADAKLNTKRKVG